MPDRPANAQFPTTRMRRNRQTNWSRRLIRENTLTVDDLIWPIFVVDGKNQRVPVESMLGVDRVSVDLVGEEARKARDLGIPVIALFPYTDPAKRNANGSEALNPGNLVCSAVKAIKDAAPEIGVMCDVALDPYTDHGQDGLIDETGRILNDETLEVLVEQSIIQAQAGCDIIAPSDMMDGRIAAIRGGLDEMGLADVLLMAYSAKYASAFYGPFRDAVGSLGTLKGDKKTYQMDPANADEALREIALDIQEGADMIMVKPGMPYLDIVTKAKSTFGMPTFAYQVSGEYAMLKGAAERGWIDGDAVAFESLLAFKRAGADGILTYFAPDVAGKLNG